MLISSRAMISPDVLIWEGVVIEDNVRIGSGCRIGYHVILHEGTILENDVWVGDHTVLGKLPFRAANSALTAPKPLSALEIRRDTKIGALCVLYRGAVLSEKVFIGDLASVREEVSIDRETIIGKGVTVENRCTIGKRCKIETNAYITAFSEIADYCFIAPEVTLTNDNFLGRTEERKKYFKGAILEKGARIGANATLLPGITVGEDALIGAGSVVTKDVPARKIYFGVPARFFGDVPEEQWLINQSFYEGEEE